MRIQHKIFVFPKVFAEICVRGVNARGSLKNQLFCKHRQITRQCSFSRKLKKEERYFRFNPSCESKSQTSTKILWSLRITFFFVMFSAISVDSFDYARQHVNLNDCIENSHYTNSLCSHVESHAVVQTISHLICFQWILLLVPLRGTAMPG